jgi:DNA-binding FrmR family transcriptional regulator
MAHLDKNGDALVKRIRRIIGQLEGVERAILAEKDCTATLHQAAAVRGAVNGLVDELIESHIHEHVANEQLTPEQRKEGAEDLIVAIRRYAK